MREGSGAGRRRLALVLALCVLAVAVALAAVWRGGRRARGAVEESAVTIERASALDEDEDPLESTSLAPAAEAAVERDERRSATPELPTEAQWVEGRVVFPPGALLDDATVVAYSGSRFEDRKGMAARITRARIGADGRFRIAFAPRARDGSVWVHGAWLFQPEPLEIDLRPPPQDLVLEPVLAGRIRGRLIAPDGLGFRPGELDGAVVSADDRVVRNREDSVERAYRASIGADGSFLLDGLEPTSSTSLRFALPGLVDERVEEVLVRAGEITDVEVRVQRAVRVSGRVVDEVGRALGGIRVVVISAPGQRFGAQADQESDEAGGFDLRGLAAGELKVRVESREHLPFEQALGARGGGEHVRSLELVLANGLSIEGRVTWPDGSPAARASVRRVEAGREQASLETETLDDGGFRVSGLSAGSFHVVARARDRRQGETRVRLAPLAIARVDAVPAGSLELALVLGSGAVLRGRVEDERGVPVGRFGLRLGPVFDGGGFSPVESVVQDFESVDGGFELSGLDQVGYVATARAQGYLESIPVTCTPASGEAIVLVLARPAMLAGNVVDADGRPVAKAVVECRSVRSREAGEPPLLSSGSERVRTREDGSFAELEAHGGRVALVASAVGHGDSEPLHVEVDFGEERGGLVLRLASCGRITGVVHAYQGEVAGREVELVGGRRAETVRTDAAGRFEFEELQAGGSTLTLLANDGREDEVEFAGAGGTHRIQGLREVARARVELSAGASVHVVLGSPPAMPRRVHGVIREAGRPVVGEFVRVRGGSGSGATRRGSESTAASVAAKAFTGPGGEYGFVLDGEGEYLLCVGALGSEEREFPFVLSGGGDLRFDVELPTGRISGVVVGPAGPLAGVDVRVRRIHGARGDPKGSAVTSEAGEFSVGRLPAGTYRVEASSAAFADGVQHGIELGDGQVRGDVRIELRTGGVVEGRLLDVAGRPVTNTWIEVVDLEGADLAWGRLSATDAQGNFRVARVRAGPIRVRASVGQVVEAEATVIEGGTTRVELRAGG